MQKELEKRILSSLIIIPISFFFIIQGSIFFIFFLSIFFLGSSYEWIKLNKKEVIKILLGIILIFVSFYSAYHLRQNLGFLSFLFIVLICIFTDIGGYIFGKIFKGPKLTKISPNKTYSGVFGSFILSIIGGLIYNYYFDLFEIKYLLNMDQAGTSLKLPFLLFILFISSISQIGDLIISYFKRIAKVKNTGKILPGHGGLLDRIDGLIFAIPATQLLLSL